MTPSDALLARIEADRTIADLLSRSLRPVGALSPRRRPGGPPSRFARPGDFDIDRRDPVEPLRLPTGVPLHPIAGCGAGGTYFLCGDPGTAPRPVLYADSEDQAVLMGADLAEAVEVIALLPYWDLGGNWHVEELEQDVRDDHPDFDELRGLQLPALEVG